MDPLSFEEVLLQIKLSNFKDLESVCDSKGNLIDFLEFYFLESDGLFEDYFRERSFQES